MPGYIDPYGFSKSGGKSSGGGGRSGGGYVDPYGFGKAKASKPAGHQHHDGGGLGGFFHSVGHYVASKASLAGHDLAGMPGGAYQIAKDELRPGYDSVAHFGDTRRLRRDNRKALRADEAIAKSTYESVRHPLRDPFQTALTLAPAIGQLGKLGEAGIAASDAARVGEGGLAAARAAGKAYVGKGAKLTPRTLKMGKEEIALPPSSGNAAVRLAQKGYANRLQHALDTNPEGRLAAHAAKRVGGSIAEQARYQARMREVPAQLLLHAGRELRGSIGKHIPFTDSKAAEAALRLTSENSTAEEAAAFHRAQAEAGVGRARNLKLAKLYDEIHKSGLLKQDEHGNVVVNAEKFPKLAAADRALARAQADAERIVHQHGLMTDEGAQVRVNAPAQIRQRVENLPDNSHYFNQFGDSFPAKFADGTRDTGNLSFHNIHDAHGNVIGSAVYDAGKGRKSIYVESVYMRPEFRNAGNFKRLIDPLLKDGRPIQAEFQNPRLQKIFERGIGKGSVAGKALRHETDVSIARGEAPRSELPPLRSAPIRQGRGYVPYKLTEPRASRNSMARAGSSVVGKAKSPIGAKSFTGKGLEEGLVPDNTTGLVARHLKQLHKYVNTDAYRRKVIGTGSDVKRTTRDILARLPDQPAGEIPLGIERDLGRKNITLDELAGHRQALADRIRNLIPGYEPNAVRNAERFKSANSEAARYGIGEKAPKGFIWVDRNVLGDIGNAFSFSRGGAGRFADSVNSAVTLATVYLKPGHLPQRTLTNATTVLFQTSLNPRALADAVKVWGDLSHEDRMRALGAAGQGGYEAMPHEGTGFVGRQATKGANWWSKHVDAPFRFANIAYEARKAGYRTPAEFRRFLHILEQPERFPKEEALRVETAAKESNRAGIAYDRMSDAERRTIGRLVWFYPWIRNSSLYTGRVLVNHPYKASIMAQLGAEGRKNQANVLGALPSYEYGLAPVGKGKVSDLGRLFPFSTAADVLQIPQHENAARGNLNPAYSALLDLITGTNSFGGQTKSPVGTALQDLVGSMPESQILTDYLHRHQDQSRHMFPHSGHLGGTEDALLRALLGSWFPRRINKGAANSSAARESSGR